MSVLFAPLQSIAAFAFLALPSLNPLAPGPSPAVVPWLVALIATAVLILTVSVLSASGETRGGAGFAQRWAPAAAQAWAFAGLVSSVIGLLQYFGAAAALSQWASQASPGEAFANLRQRNQFASLTNMALVTLIWLGVGANGRFAGRHRWAARSGLPAGSWERRFVFAHRDDSARFAVVRSTGFGAHGVSQLFAVFWWRQCWWVNWVQTPFAAFADFATSAFDQWTFNLSAE